MCFPLSPEFKRWIPSHVEFHNLMYFRESFGVDGALSKSKQDVGERAYVQLRRVTSAALFLLEMCDVSIRVSSKMFGRTYQPHGDLSNGKSSAE